MSLYKTEKAVFVGVVLEKGGERKVQEYLDELQFLAETAGAIGDKLEPAAGEPLLLEHELGIFGIISNHGVKFLQIYNEKTDC